MNWNRLNLNNLSQDEINDIYRELMDFSKDISLWEPHQKQRLFHDSTAKGRLVFGGNRSGKTSCGWAEAQMHLTGKYPKWYKEENKMEQPVVGRVIVSDFSKGFAETVKKHIDEWLPSKWIKSIKKNHEGYPERYELINGSVFDVCTHMQDKNVFEGWCGHFAWFDEPPPRFAFIGTLRGLIDYKGKYWMTMTPLNQPWIYDELILSKDENIFSIHIDTSENPFIAKEEIEEFTKRLTEEEKEARLKGKFLHLTGLVYKTVEPNIHFATLNLKDLNSSFRKMQKQWYFILDPHDRRPHCGIWGFVNPNNKKYVAYELVLQGTISELCAYIKSFEEFNHIPEPIRIGDPNKMETPTSVSGLRLKDEFAKRGLYFITNIDDNLQRGHMAVKEQLYYDKTRQRDEFNSPSLYFSEEVPTVREHFLKYTYQDWRGSSLDTKNPRETPKDLFKDFPDCVRYWIMSNPIYFKEEFSGHNWAASNRTGYR